MSVRVVDLFQKTFPHIKVNSLRARGGQLSLKITAQRRAEKSGRFIRLRQRHSAQYRARRQAPGP
jgi:hypothetical protein